MKTSSLSPHRSGQRLIIGLSTAFWGITLHLYWPNNGGSGLSLPMNIMAWLYAGLIMGGASCLLSRRRWRITTPSLCIIAGTFLLTLLCLLTPAIWRSEAILVAGAITGGALFYLVLLQIPLTGKVFTQLLTILWGASLLECGIFTLQYLHLPLAQFWEFPWWRDARPYGIFQQVNLMASFTASGTLLSATLALRTGARCRIAIGAGMLLMGFVLHESQSQTGYLSLFIGWFLLLCCFPARRRLAGLLLLLILGMALGECVRRLLSVAIIDHQTSTRTRWEVLRDCWTLFTHHPWMGSGVGSFPALFLMHFGHTGLSRIAHPHNELVLWLVEGGMVGLAGTACFISAGVRLWLAGNVWRRACLLCAVPVLIHMLTEYPVWQSTPHWLLLILLMRCADRPIKGTQLAGVTTMTIRTSLALLTLIVIPLLGKTLHIQQQLTAIERQGEQWRLQAQVPPGGWLLRSRYQFDIHMGYLQRYQQTKDERWLNAFRHWASRYVRVHPDPNVSFTRILIAQHQHDFALARHLAHRFYLEYPKDRRIPWLQDTRRPFNHRNNEHEQKD